MMFVRFQFAEIALSKELIETRDYFQADYFIALSRLQLMKKEYTEAMESLANATTLDHEVGCTSCFTETE